MQQLKQYENHSDADLVQLCIQREPMAQRVLYERYKARMMAFCRRYFQRQDLAEEFFQEGFVRFFQKIEQYDSKYPLYPYLKKIFLYAGINYLRQFFSEKYNTAPLETLAEYSDPEPGIMPSLSYQDLLGLMAKMQEADALVLQLALIEEWTHEEIAVTLGITEGNSRARLLRARKKLMSLIPLETPIT
ncbi:MAG: sigma-70 family RNA polymerase sigma factor [Chitinophagales bacterium]|nr:sigma-70 family RNA polymerase sigma factor [Chitinophagales bacterium]